MSIVFCTIDSRVGWKRTFSKSQLYLWFSLNINFSKNLFILLFFLLPTLFYFHMFHLYLFVCFKTKKFTFPNFSYCELPYILPKATIPKWINEYERMCRKGVNVFDDHKTKKKINLAKFSCETAILPHLCWGCTST
jgi:hypothetical protein